MTERTRRRLFAAVASPVIAAAAVAAMLGGAGEEPPPRAPAARAHASDPAPVILTALEPERGPHGHDDVEPERDLGPPALRGGGHERRHARRTARRFLAALDRVQRGASDRRTEHTLRATAAEPLAHQLTARAPRPTGTGPATAKLVDLELRGPERGEIAAAALIEYQVGPTSQLDFTLRQQRGGWRVSELYPEG